jgi:hypothetical protein
MVDITTPLSGQHFLISGTHLVLNIFVWMNLKLIFMMLLHQCLLWLSHSVNFRRKHVWIRTHTHMFKFICLFISFLPSISMLTFTIVCLRLWCLFCNVYSCVVNFRSLLYFVWPTFFMWLPACLGHLPWVHQNDFSLSSVYRIQFVRFAYSHVVHSSYNNNNFFFTLCRWNKRLIIYLVEIP